MGSGVRKPKPAKSDIVSAIEHLIAEYEETGELPELVTPGIPDELLDQWAAEDAAELQMLHPNVSDVSPEGAAALGLIANDVALDSLGLLADSAARAIDVADDKEVDEDDGGEDGGGDIEDDDDDDLLASLLGEDDFDDDLSLDDDEVESAANRDDEVPEDREMIDLFGDMVVSSDGGVEATGMSPGDSG